MSWLILSIICSTLIFVLFKLFDQWKVNNLLAIVVNYVVAYLVGGIDHGFEVAPWQTPEYPWFTSVLILGFLFITLFQIMAFVSQKIGVSVVSVAVKMSLIIPVLFGLIYYGEKFSVTKIAGVVLALLAVYLATRKKEKIKTRPLYAWLPIFLFVASGFMDVFIKFNQQEKVPAAEHSIFASS
ncbi:MAG: EamA family transporter, partial [Owenweeksia sp.]